LAFDSDGDHILTSQDARWSEFGIWQDADSDGQTDEGEFHSLDELQISAIALETEEVSIEESKPEPGVLIHGKSVVTFEDGSTTTAVDASLSYIPGEDSGENHALSNDENVNYDIKISSDINLEDGWLSAATMNSSEISTTKDSAISPLQEDIEATQYEEVTSHKVLFSAEHAEETFRYTVESNPEENYKTMLTDSGDSSSEDILGTDTLDNSTDVWHSQEPPTDLPMDDNGADHVFSTSEEPFQTDDPADPMDDGGTLCFGEDHFYFSSIVMIS
ncbi:MAG: hypothetical protein HQK65_21560, partial [Desulfamplus sp.]|nr:hypothetical protein [Desulfamplus sp.]